MGIDKLRYFAVVVETKNLRRAAEIVGIAPGSMSKAIMKLESEIGFKLLRPEGRGIEITEQGMEVYRKSAHLLEEYRIFMTSMENPLRENYEQLRIGTFEVFSSYFLSEFILNEFPNHSTMVLELTPGKIEKSILDNTIDMGLTYVPAANTNLEFSEIGSFNMGIWGLEKWKKRTFEEWPFAVPTTSVKLNSSSYNSLDMWPQHKKSRNIKYQFELLETALQTTRAGQSVIHCPDFIIILHNRSVKSDFELYQLPYPNPIKKSKPIKIFLVTKKGSPFQKLAEGKLAKFVRSLK